jgi:hypothetical protein
MSEISERQGFTVYTNGNNDPLMIGSLGAAFDIASGGNSGVLSATQDKLLLIVPKEDSRIWMSSTVPGAEIGHLRSEGYEKEFVLKAGEILYVISGSVSVSVYN